MKRWMDFITFSYTALIFGASGKLEFYNLAAAVLDGLIRNHAWLPGMASNTCLFQVVGLVPKARPIPGSFVKRACRFPRPLTNAAPPITRCVSSAVKDSSEPAEGENNSFKPAQQPFDTEAALAAFDSLIDDIEADSEEHLSAGERRKLARDRQLEAAREAHLQRLQILSEIPNQLLVEDVKDKCPGCGTVLQSVSPDRPGFLPTEVLENRLSEQMSETKPTVHESTVESSSEEPLQIGPPKAENRSLICQRCFRLTHYGKIENHLRVPSTGLTTVAPEQNIDGHQPRQRLHKAVIGNELSAAKFRKSVQRLKNVNAVVIYLVDMFDFHGSFIPSIRDIIGTKNPILLAVNKTDLLPKDYRPERVQRWIEQECSALGLRDIAGIHLISSMKGTGVRVLLADALRVAKNRRADLYVVGAANVGKSSFINQLMRMRKRDGSQSKEKRKMKGRKSPQHLDTDSLTTSVVPGTTLDLIRIPLGGTTYLYDTPGLIIPHQLTNFLESKELRAVLPDRSIERVTFRLGEGKALYIGALARIEVVSGKPFFFTAFFSPNVKVHPGKAEGADEFVAKHVGSMLTPPFSEERFMMLGEWTSKSFTADGEGWKKSCVDVVLSGLGWVAVTGSGSVRLRICIPKGVGVFTREPLMPFETQAGVSTYTGSTAVNRKQMKRTSRKRKSFRND